MIKIKLNIAEKLLIVVILGLIVSFSVLAVIRIDFAKQSFAEEITRSGQDQGALLAESLANLIVAYDYSNMESLAERVVKMEDVLQIRILNRADKLMVERTSNRFGPNHNGLLFVTEVIFLGDKLGSVELLLAQDRLTEIIRQTYLNIIIVTLFSTVFLGFLLYLATSTFISKPLARLSKAADQLALGDFSAVLPPVSVDELGHLVHAFSSMRDTRQRVEGELSNLNARLEHIVMARVAELRSSETYIRAVLENMNEGIIVVDAANRVVTFNPAADKIFGFARDEMIGQSFNLLISTESLDQSGKYPQYTDEISMLGITREVIGMRKDISAFPLELKTSQIQIQEKLLFIITARDISDRKDAERRISYMASHDALTKLPNRALLDDRIQQTLAHNQRTNMQAAIIYIDLDKFKLINDTLGHDVGDELLKETAVRLVSHVRIEDTVARHGGDEFIILLTDIARPEDAGLIAQKLLDSLLRPFMIQGNELFISASIGIALFPDDGRDMETLLKNSDIAMYHAKESGRNNFQFFSSQMNELAAEKNAIINELRYAIERDQLFLCYQPVADVSSNDIIGMEVLLRWQHPQFGMVSPVKFIPLAEESGLILQIGEWVLRSACKQLQAWLAQGYEVPRLAINLSTKQFTQKSLVDTITLILAENGTAPHHIGFEITESMLVHNIDDVVKTLTQLSEMGLEISIDDFGTGYSSLSYLKRFPINKLKIDKSFVDDIATHPDDAAIVIAIISMAHGLSMRVVCEGVETQQQLDFLRQQDCEQYQGYIFSKPLPAAEIVAKLTRKYLPPKA